MTKINLELPPVGVKILRGPLVGFEDVEIFHGDTYCDAVRQAALGDQFLVTPESIDVCLWSPVVLGLKLPENRFEHDLVPRIEQWVAAVYVARLPDFRAGVEPDVVIIREFPEQIKRILGALGEAELITKYRGRIGNTALGVGENGRSIGILLTQATNRSLARLRNIESFKELSKKAFRNPRVSAGFEKVFGNVVADASVCRNSTTIPFLEDACNMAFFCAGAIAWGENSPAHMTCGIPARLSGKVSDLVEY